MTRPGIAVRQAAADDARAIAAVHVEGWRWAYRGLVPDAWLDALSVDQREAMWRATLSAPDTAARVWLTERAGRAVGSAATAPSRIESDAIVERIRRHLACHGFGLWAIEAPGVADFIGFVGLLHVAFAAAFNPAVEVGWRLAAAHWGRGYASEAARGALEAGFEPCQLEQIVSMTVPPAGARAT